jgi:hypothetical protein
MRKSICILLCIITLSSTAQPDYTHYSNFYAAIKNYDLSALWSADSILLDDGEKASFPEPLGYIGVNFQRFYIHYLSIVKSRDDPYTYHVTGKTKVGDNICTFSGSITVTKAIQYNKVNFPPYREGTITCKVRIYEDSAHKGSGSIEGSLDTDFYLGTTHKIFYNTLMDNADSYCNNQCRAVWKSYKTGTVKKCNWGDYRIPDSRGLDVGAGVFCVNEEYIKFGWDSYTKVEDTKWWEK